MSFSKGGLDQEGLLYRKPLKTRQEQEMPI